MKFKCCVKNVTHNLAHNNVYFISIHINEVIAKFVHEHASSHVTQKLLE